LEIPNLSRHDYKEKIRRFWIQDSGENKIPMKRRIHLLPVRNKKKIEIKFEMKNYNSKREELEQEDQGEDERNVIL